MIRLTLKREEISSVGNDFNVNASGTNREQQQQPKLRINLSSLNAASSANTAMKSTVTTASTSSNNQNQNVKQLPSSGSLEEQFILRLPPSLASILSTELAENDFALPGDLVIQFISPRCALVQHPRFIKSSYPAVLVDSPTVMETFKSSNLNITNICKNDSMIEEDEQDPKTASPRENNTHLYAGQYYKVADLNQILMVLDLDTQDGQRVFNRIPLQSQQKLSKALKNGYSAALDSEDQQQQQHLEDTVCSWAQWPDGLTPPMKAAKARRFASRLVHASSVGELERIEREVERLLKADAQAIESTFSLMSAEGEILLGSVASSSSSSSSLVQSEEIKEDRQEESGEGNIVEEAEDETEDVEMEEGDFEEEEQDEDQENQDEELSDFAAEIEDNLLEQEQEGFEPSVLETQELVATIESESDRLVRELEEKLAEKLRQAATVTNPLIKARIEDVIRQMEDNLKHLKENK